MYLYYVKLNVTDYRDIVCVGTRTRMPLTFETADTPPPGRRPPVGRLPQPSGGPVQGPNPGDAGPRSGQPTALVREDDPCDIRHTKAPGKSAILHDPGGHRMSQRRRVAVIYNDVSIDVILDEPGSGT